MWNGSYNRVFGGILKNLPVQRKIEKWFVPGDFLRFRQKRDYKSRRTKFKYSVFWGSLNKTGNCHTKPSQGSGTTDRRIPPSGKERVALASVRHGPASSDLVFNTQDPSSLAARLHLSFSVSATQNVGTPSGETQHLLRLRPPPRRSRGASTPRVIVAPRILL